MVDGILQIEYSDNILTGRHRLVRVVKNLNECLKTK